MKPGPRDPHDARTPVLPSLGHRNEIGGRHELDVHREPFLDLRNGAKQPVIIGTHDQVDVDVESRQPISTALRSTDEIDPQLAGRRTAQRLEDSLQPLAID